MLNSQSVTPAKTIDRSLLKMKSLIQEKLFLLSPYMNQQELVRCSLSLSDHSKIARNQLHPRGVKIDTSGVFTFGDAATLPA
jgi:hypothetical protein